MANVKELNKIIHNCYEIYTKNFMRKFIDTDWSNIYRMVSRFNYIPSVDDVELFANGYVNFPKSNIDDPSYKCYNITITSKYGVIVGEVQCHLAGPMDDPLSSYDIILSLRIQEKEKGLLTESVLNEALNFRGALAELQNAQDFNDIKRIVKKYTKEGMLAASLATMILANCRLSDEQFYQIEQDAYRYEQEYYNYHEWYDDDEEEPQWKLITDDVEATVYNAVTAQCNNDIKHTASGFELDLSDPESHRIIAMERSMMAKYGLKYGDIVKIEGTDGRDGIYQIQDTMNKRFKDRNKIDILVNNNIKYGAWNNVEIYKLTNPEQVYDTIKEDMRPALNQERMDKRQSPLTESFRGIGLLNFGDMDEIHFEQHETKSTKTMVTQASLDLIKQWMLENLVNAESPMKESIEENPEDVKFFEDDDLLTYYDVLDVQESGEQLLPDPDPNIGPKARKRHEMDLRKRRMPVKNNKMYFRILVDKKDWSIRICIHNPYYTCKYLTIGKPLIDFISNCLVPIKSIGIYGGNRITLDANHEPMMSNVTDDLTFFFNKNWKGQSYYIPRNYKADKGMDFPDNVKVTQDFVDHFPENIASKFNGYSDKTIPMYVAMFPNIAGYLKVAKAFISAGYKLYDEYGNVYDEKTIAEAEEMISASTNPAEKAKKESKIETFLVNTLGQTALNAFETALKNNTYKHFYIRMFNKLNRKQKNIYKKLSRDVVKQFITDNGIDLYDILKKSNEQCEKAYKELDDMVAALQKPGFDITTYEVINKSNDAANLVKANLPSYKVTNHDNFGRIIMSAGVGNGYYYDYITKCGEDSLNKMNEEVLINRFYCKFNEKLIVDNPNGWNNKSSVDPLKDIFDLIREEGYGYYSRETARFVDFCDVSLAVDCLEDLMYFYYDCAYALINSYCQSQYGSTTAAIKEFVDAKQEPDLSKINFDAISKCLKTILQDMSGTKLV